ncbi:MAG: bifunctional 2-polyprenyl-6-hydroxyphenol methylase/3-demethylubiquinol 3-O-methyltransferase UbiG [Pseudomonadota bacterium]
MTLETNSSHDAATKTTNPANKLEDVPGSKPTGATIDPEEVTKFEKIAAEWWDPNGKFKPLHKFNPTRLAYISETVIDHFGRDATAQEPLKGLRLMDVGCGGGLVCEPMRRLGAEVVGVDAAERNVKTAMVHAAESRLEIDYRAATVESLVEAGEEPFDVVLNLEAVEHVADVDLFLQSSAKLVKPGGIMIVATINRTLRALITAKIGAEYILRWLPMGTHDPRKFVKPNEIADALAPVGMTVAKKAGVAYNPLTDKWNVVDDVSVNFMVVATRST